MKKLLVMLLAAAMCVSMLAGCSGSGSEGGQRRLPLQDADLPELQGGGSASSEGRRTVPDA